MRLIIATIAALLLAACTPAAAPPQEVAAPAAAATDTGPVVLASLDSPAFLENLIVDPDGTITFTNYTGRTIHRIAPDGTLSILATLDAHPVSLLRLGNDILVAAHRIPFTAGPEFIGSGQLLTLSATGEVLERLDAPQAGFLNGMVTTPGGKVLIADSVNAQILEFDPASKTLSSWFSAPELAPQTEPVFLPGANGLKLDGGALIVSSSARRTLYRLGLTADGSPDGALLVLHADLPGTDDFIVLPEGGYVASTHAATVVRMAPGSASAETVTSDPRIKGNTAVALRGSGASRTLIVLGTGGFSEGLEEPGVVMELPLPQ